MSWLKRITGMDELIFEQRRATQVLMEMLDMQLKKDKKPKGPSVKNYK